MSPMSDSHEKDPVLPPPSDYGDIDAQAHLETLKVLSQARDYLSRLPAHPATYRALKDIQEHLDSPQQLARSKRLLSLAKSQNHTAKVFAGNEFMGTSRFTPEGIPHLQFTLLDMTLHVTSPALVRMKDQGLDTLPVEQKILSDLREGVSVRLDHPVRFLRAPRT